MDSGSRIRVAGVAAVRVYRGQLERPRDLMLPSSVTVSVLVLLASKKKMDMMLIWMAIPTLPSARLRSVRSRYQYSHHFATQSFSEGVGCLSLVMHQLVARVT